jgi:DNA-binding NarL/FixJ family response regulator
VRSPPIRVILADDHAIVLDGLRRLFQQQGDFEVVACCQDGEQALSAVRRGGADIVVLDLRMPGLSGLDVLRAISTEARGCRTVLLTAAVTDADALEALRLGAMGLVLKESSPDALIECVLRVHAGEQWIDRSTMARAFGRVLHQDVVRGEISKKLTPREIEIVLMVSQGRRNRTIAELLSISEGTVKIHLHNVYEKLGLDGRLALALWVQEQGLV